MEIENNIKIDVPINLDCLDPDTWIKDESAHRNLILNQSIRKQIPLLNSNGLHVVKNNRLVRFRGMIQDMHNPEFFLEKFEILNKTTKECRIVSGKYRDTADVKEDESVNYTSSDLLSAERHTMVTISLPGFNEWAQNMENELNHFDPLLHSPSTSKKSTSSKRPLDDTDSEETMAETKLNKEKKIRDEQENGNDEQKPPSIVSTDHLLNFPLPDSKGKVCIVKVYNDFQNLKLNDMVEIIGFLSVDPDLGNWTGSKNCDEEQMDVETLTHNPPTSLIPRIHAVHVEKLSHCNPLVDTVLQTDGINFGAINEARDHLKKALTGILFGDSLAAEYLICYLISCVYTRKDDLVLGKFSLNLSNIPSQKYPDYTKQFYGIIKQFVTKSHYLPMTLDNLNTTAFLPKKDYDCNRLTSGVLQLSKNTHLVLDETQMQPGKLDNSGVLNIAAIGNMIISQKINYDFKFYKLDFDCDIPVLILSEGASLLPKDFAVPIIPDPSDLRIAKEIFDATNFYLNKDVLNKIRTYITTLQLATYTIDEEPTYVQEDFVEMRKNGSQSDITGESLHQLLVLARLIGLSMGQTKLNKECWDITKNMEEERRQRIKK